MLVRLHMQDGKSFDASTLMPLIGRWLGAAEKVRDLPGGGITLINKFYGNHCSVGGYGQFTEDSERRGTIQENIHGFLVRTSNVRTKPGPPVLVSQFSICTDESEDCCRGIMYCDSRSAKQTLGVTKSSRFHKSYIWIVKLVRRAVSGHSNNCALHSRFLLSFAP